jgi:hypothetical protein
VQPDANLWAMLAGPLHELGGAVMERPAVRIVTAEPRHFVDQARERFDLIQLVTLESTAAGTMGIGGMSQDHLLTVEGITACLRLLSDGGILTVSRGIQDPPRDTLKLLATIAEAMRAAGTSAPERHVVVVRDFLAVCTIVKASPWTDEQVVDLRRALHERDLTPVWFPGVREKELNRPDELPGPPGQPGDWYHYGAVRLFGGASREFIGDWAFDIRPPTDDRPFFLDFCKVSSVGDLRDAYGDLWLTRSELAFLFVLTAAVIVAVVGALLTVLPLLVWHRGRARKIAGGPGHRPGAKARGRAATGLYFTAIGMAYMFLEITFLSRLIHWMGDPVLAAAVAIAGFLLASGLGSLTAQRLGDDAGRWLPRVVGALIVLGLIEQLVLGRLAAPVGGLSLVLSCGASFVALAPLGYLMGFPMPLALRRLQGGNAGLIPWAWGVNGFASVIGAPLAMAIAMTWGFSVAGGLALLLYLVPIAAFARLPAE